MGVILGLLAALLWGISDLLARFAGRAIGAWRTLFYAELIGLALLSAWIAGLEEATIGEIAAATPWSVLAIGLFAGVVQLVGAYALTEALTIGPISLVMPLASSYGAVSAALSIATGEPITPVALLGIVVTVVGVGLAGAAEQTQEADARGRGVAWAMVAAASYGIAFWAQGRYLVPAIGPLPAVWVFLAIGVVVMTACAMIGMGSLAFPPRDAVAVTFGSGTLAIAAYIAVALGFATGEVAIVAVLSTLSSVVTALLGYAVLSERLAPRQLGGVVLILIGVVVINLG